MSDPTEKNGFGIVGIGAAICAACCAGPIIAILGGVTIAGIAWTMFVTVASLIVAVAATAYLLVRRRRQTPACAADAPVPVTFTAKPAPAGDAADELTSEGAR